MNIFLKVVLVAVLFFLLIGFSVTIYNQNKMFDSLNLLSNDFQSAKSLSLFQRDQLESLAQEMELTLSRISGLEGDLFQMEEFIHNLRKLNELLHEDLDSASHDSSRKFAELKAIVEDNKQVISLGNSEESLISKRLDPVYQQEGAKKMALEVLSRKSSDLESLRILGQISFEEGDLYSAKKYYEQLIEVDSSDMEAYEVLGRICLRAKDYEKSADYFSRLVALKKDPLYHYNLALSYYYLERLDLAAYEVERALTLNPDSLNSLVLAGKIYYLDGNWGKALFHYEKASILEPKNDYFVRQGDIYCEFGELESAITNWNIAVDHSNLNVESDNALVLETYEKIALFAYELGDNKQIESVYGKVEELGDNELVHFIYLKSLKSRDEMEMLSLAIDRFEEMYPVSDYEPEIVSLKIWTEGS